MKSLTARQIVTVLQKNGFVLVRQKGSHAIWKHERLAKMVSIPMHGGNRPIPIGTCRQIVKQSGIAEEEFFAQ